MERYIVQVGEFGRLDHNDHSYHTGDIVLLTDSEASLLGDLVKPALQDITSQVYPEGPAAPQEPAAPTEVPGPAPEAAPAATGPEAPQAPATEATLEATNDNTPAPEAAPAAKTDDVQTG